MKIQIRNHIKVSILLLALFSLVACDQLSSSSSGGGEDEQVKTAPIAPPIGPDLSGDTWQGYFQSLSGAFTPLTASITHDGDKIIIDTSLPDDTLAGRFQGRISSVGGLFLFDTFDAEDWTTLYGPASENSINLADFVFVDGSQVDTNIIILKR